MKHLYRLFAVYMIWWLGGQLVALRAEDNLEVSLLTCSPGGEVYSLYGHTAMRCRDLSTDEDYVFNYGLFSFGQPNFVLRFALGKCDYMVGMTSFSSFREEYLGRGSFVIQQVLNLNREEKERLIHALATNCLPQNRVYRYNYLDNNCTTRVRDQVEAAVSGEVVYADPAFPQTFREIMHRYTVNHPWAELGNDLCLGADVDTLLDARAQLFVPFFLKEAYGKAVIRTSEGNERPLVLRTELIGNPMMGNGENSAPYDLVATTLLSPGILSWEMVVVILVLALLQIRKHKVYWGIDLVLMTMTGLAGCIIAFLFFCSEHPTVDTNWQIWVLNPLPLFAMPWVVYCAYRKKKTGYHLLNCTVLTLFILFSSLIPQDFSVVVVPLALVLCIRSAGYIIHYRREQKGNVL